MATGQTWKTLAIATVAAGIVWLLTVATFRPDAYVDNRPFCSGGAMIPYTVDGVRVEPTRSPGCRFGPLPADALGPSPALAIATFVFVGGVGLVVGIRRS